MSRKSLLVLPLVGALVLFLTGSVSAQAAAEPGPEQPKTYTMTICNGGKVCQWTFVWVNGSWRLCDDCDRHDVFCRDCPRSPWPIQGTYCSPRRAEEAACSLRANGRDPDSLNLASAQGKYTHLLRKIEVPGDRNAYGDFNDYGYWNGTEWAGYRNLPPGYWVYVAPYWYVWGDVTGR